MFHHNRKSRGVRALVLALFIIATGALAHHAMALPSDRNKPIHITADQALRDDKKGVTVYSGNVEMQQGTLRIAADKITISDVDGRASKIVASGSPAKLQQRPAAQQAILYAQARLIEYFNDVGKVRFQRQARIEQDGSKVTGDTIDYDINQQIVKAGAGAKTGNDRVEVVIPPHLINDKTEAGVGNTDR